MLALVCSRLSRHASCIVVSPAFPSIAPLCHVTWSSSCTAHPTGQQQQTWAASSSASSAPASARFLCTSSSSSFEDSDFEEPPNYIFFTYDEHSFLRTGPPPSEERLAKRREEMRQTMMSELKEKVPPEELDERVRQALQAEANEFPQPEQAVVDLEEVEQDAASDSMGSSSQKPSPSPPSPSPESVAEKKRELFQHWKAMASSFARNTKDDEMVRPPLPPQKCLGKPTTLMYSDTISLPHRDVKLSRIGFGGPIPKGVITGKFFDSPWHRYLSEGGNVMELDEELVGNASEVLSVVEYEYGVRKTDVVALTTVNAVEMLQNPGYAEQYLSKLQRQAGLPMVDIAFVQGYVDLGVDTEQRHKYLQECFEQLERLCDLNILGGYGVVSDQLGLPRHHSDFLDVEKVQQIANQAADKIGFETSGFCAIRVPVNMVQPHALLERNCSGGLTTVQWAKANNLAVFGDRPFDTYTHPHMPHLPPIRLRSTPDFAERVRDRSEEIAQELNAACNLAIGMEKGYAEWLQSYTGSNKSELPSVENVSIAQHVVSLLPRLDYYRTWEYVFHTQIYKDANETLRRLIMVPEAHPFFEQYQQILHAFFVSVSNHVELRDGYHSHHLNDQLGDYFPDLQRSRTLHTKNLSLLLAIPSIDCILTHAFAVADPVELFRPDHMNNPLSVNEFFGGEPFVHFLDVRDHLPERDKKNKKKLVQSHYPVTEEAYDECACVTFEDDPARPGHVVPQLAWTEEHALEMLERLSSFVWNSMQRWREQTGERDLGGPKPIFRA